jgi:hypothetical protein
MVKLWEILQKISLEKRPQRISVFLKNSNQCLQGNVLNVFGPEHNRTIELHDTPKRRVAYIPFECIGCIGNSVEDGEEEIPPTHWLGLPPEGATISRPLTDEEKLSRGT